MSRHLIVGCAGLVGTTLARLLIQQGQEVVGVDNFRAARDMPAWRAPAYQWRKNLIPGEMRSHEFDIRDTGCLAGLIDQTAPDVVHFLAALLAGEARANPQEARAVQVDAVGATLQALSQFAHPVHLVLASSSYVYGHFDGRTVDETAELNPVDDYGKLKVESETLVRQLPENGLTWTILRPAAVYGVGDPRARFAGITIEEAVRFGRVRLNYPDLASDFTHVSDVAEAFAAVGPAHHGLTLNVTPGEAATNRQFAEIVQAELTGVSIEVASDPVPDHIPRRGALDSSRARDLLGWTPTTGITAGIQREVALACRIYGVTS
jgi:nucleoside-diphosphate-sugar epimerase